MTVQATKPITAEELFEMGDIGRCELINGEIIHMAPAGAEHGGVTMELACRVANHVKQNSLGKVYAADTGFIIARDPDTTRAPDVAFVRAERVQPRSRKGFFDGPPDLAIEVISPGDTHSQVVGKVNQWLAAGSLSVWVVDPANEMIDVYRQDHTICRYARGDVVQDEPTMPGFELNVDDLFSD